MLWLGLTFACWLTIEVTVIPITRETWTVNENPLNTSMKRFEGSEHRSAGINFANITIVDWPNDQKADLRLVRSTKSVSFKNAKGINLETYGTIIALSGDFFGVKSLSAVICSASYSPQEQANLVYSAFSDLWESSRGEYIRLAINEFNAEDSTLAGRQPGERPWEAFTRLAESRWKKFGNYFITNEFGVNEFVMKLLLNNLDHFGNCANNSYVISHTLAMREALAAGASLRDPGFASFPAATRADILAEASNRLMKAYSALDRML